MTKQQLYEKARALPLLPGVYIIRDKSDTIIYIGKAKRLRTRVSQYFREGVPHDAKVTQMIEHAFTFDVIVCQSEFEALVLEASQIKAHTPKYNILLKDDKGYSYVKVTRGEWPRLSAALQKDDDNADYIGPFTSSFAVVWPVVSLRSHSFSAFVFTFILTSFVYLFMVREWQK